MVSPLIFGSTGSRLRMASDPIFGIFIAAFGFLSFWRRTGWAHFLTLAAAVWLILSGYFTGYPAPPAAQNRIITGLILAMFAIVPNYADEMPEDWHHFYVSKSRRTTEIKR